MRIYSFDITGKVRIEESESGTHGEEKNNSMEKKGKLFKKALEYKVELIWWIIFAIDLILALILPESDFLEFLYLFHKKCNSRCSFIVYSLGNNLFDKETSNEKI